MLHHTTSSPMKPERVVILGAKGFVGGAVAKQLEHGGVDVLGLGRADLDLLSADAASRLAGILRATDSLVVVSAQAPVKNNAMLENNIRMMSAVCDAISQSRPRHIVYVSSDAVYADMPTALNEQSCAEPGSLHGVMHLAREVMLKNAYDGPLAFIRPTLIYGSDDPHNGYGPNRFRRLAAEGKEIVLFGEGEERRDHVLVDDVAALIVRMLFNTSAGVLNAATGAVTSFKDIAQMVVSLFDAPPAIQGTVRQGAMPHNGYRPFDPAATFAAFPDFAYTPLKDGLAKAHAEMMENGNG